MLRMNMMMMIASCWAVLFLLQLLIVLGMPIPALHSSSYSSSLLAHDESQSIRIQQTGQQPLGLIMVRSLRNKDSGSQNSRPVERRKVVESSPDEKLFSTTRTGNTATRKDVVGHVLEETTTTGSSTTRILQKDTPPANDDNEESTVATMEPTSTASSPSSLTDSPSQAPSIIPTMTTKTEETAFIPTMVPTATTAESLPPAATLAPSGLAANETESSVTTMAPTIAADEPNEENQEGDEEDTCACSFTRQILDNDPCRVYGGNVVVDPDNKLTAWYRARNACLLDLEISPSKVQQRAQLYNLCRPMTDNGRDAGDVDEDAVLLDVEAFIQLARNGNNDDDTNNAGNIPLSDRIKKQFLNRGYFVEARNGSIILADTLTTTTEVILDCTATPDLCWDEIEIDMRERAKRFQFLCDKELAALDYLLNEEQKTVRTQICTLLTTDDANVIPPPKSCNPLTKQIQQILKENPEVNDCSAFGKGPRQEPVPFCENVNEEYVSNPPSSLPTLLPSELDDTNSSTIPTFTPTSDTNNTLTESDMPSGMPSDAPSQMSTPLSDVNATKSLAPAASTQPPAPTLAPTVKPEPGTPVSFRIFGMSMILRGVGTMDTVARDIWIETTIKFYENVHNNGTAANMTTTATTTARQLQTTSDGKMIRDFATLITFQTQNVTAGGNTLLYTQQVSYEAIGTAPTTTSAELLQEPFRNETLNRQYAESLRASGHAAFTKLPTNKTAVSVPLVPTTSVDKNNDSDGDDDNGGLSTVEIVGIAIGGFAGLVLLLYACKYCCCRGRKNNGSGGGRKLESSRPGAKNGKDHNDDYHDEHNDIDDREQPRCYPKTPHSEPLGKIKQNKKSRDEVQPGGSPTPHSEALDKIKKDRKSRRRRSKIDDDDDDLCGDEKFTDYENKIIYGANDKNNFDDDGKNNDDLNSVMFSDHHDTADMVPPSPGMASFSSPNKLSHHPNEYYVDIEAPAGTLGITIDTPDFEGAPFIQDIDDDSVLLGKMLVGDRIIAIDGQDVSDMTAQQVSRLISHKSMQKCRKFQVLRKSEAGSKRSKQHSAWNMNAEPSEFGDLL